MRTFKILYLLPILLFSFCSSKVGNETNTTATQTQGQVFKVSGKISNYGGTQLVLNEITPQGMQPLDTSIIDATGNFSFEGFVREKTFGIISLGQYRNVFLILDTTSNIKLDIDGGATVTYQVSNSPESADIQKIANINSEYNQKIIDLDAEFQRDPTMSAEKRAEIEGKVNSLMTELKDKLAATVGTLQSPLAQIFSIEMLQVVADRATEEKIIASIDKLPANKWFAIYKPKAQSRIKTAVGSVAPDIMLNTPDGQPLSLSSLKGKYVLIDFWASWCKPCRAENPNVVRMYNQYKDKGFEILGVSLDNNQEAWKKAIMADGLTWKHISDLGGWQSSAAQLYSISSIPQTILVDKEGKIIAKGLRGAQLEEKLKTLLN